MNTVYAKLVQVMNEIGTVEKDGKHAQGYKYATAEDVSNAVRNALVKVKLAFFPVIKSVTLDNGRYLVEYEYTFADPDTGDTVTMPWAGEALAEITTRDNRIVPDDKALGKCHTYAEKYFFMRAFVVSAADDPDADTNDPQPRHKAQHETRKEAANPATLKNLRDLMSDYFGDDFHIVGENSAMKASARAGKLLVFIASQGKVKKSSDLTQECAVDLCAMVQTKLDKQKARPRAKPTSAKADNIISIVDQEPARV